MASRRPTPPDPIRTDRVRTIQGGFAFLPNRFLHHGFLDSLTHAEIALYVFLVLAADRRGMSFYAYDRICATLHLHVDEYVEARNALIKRDLIAFDGTHFQVLSLPRQPRLRAPDAPAARRTPPASPAASSPTPLQQLLRSLLDDV